MEVVAFTPTLCIATYELYRGPLLKSVNPYIFILLFYWSKAFKNRKQNINYFFTLTACYIIFILISDMSSAFLLLNIGWILIPVLLISSSQFPTEYNA